ncbi:AraC family transcriptional regulator [Chimaeribacter arupi]|uniref:AraC family transcriptional regulator n=2 Tax=Yersiniaceae TaxID=1903411 RepID=A0A2N5ELS5_9GAMM|nr:MULTISPECIES: AraC family transcriptional regulator [Yersiniaceae]MBS0967416.1 helix-turn-helix transcriptional regulator [Nissabacter archeti]PLR34565.1 AraC family transcriptional regulator [Chimaeribacter arupi]PLR46534.1 AraC family transcriptional regulator [Chimaeribacter arupi]PLR47298.1 AraC family transcriptional regulator [Chimaeribacter arupi]PLR48370.1 AraC family transcriptional regulator [Chimaeribacter arupi]
MERTIRSYPGVGIAGHLIQHSALCVPSIYVSRPCLIYVSQGYNILRTREGELRIEQGEMLALNGGQTLDVYNGLDEKGLYASKAIACDPALLADFSREHTPLLSPVASAAIIPDPANQFAHSFDCFFDALMTSPALPAPIARHRMQEQILWLAQHGVRLHTTPPATLSQQVRELLLTDIAHPWPAAVVAERLEMNEVMLRRRLAAEAEVLRNIIADTRMTHALHLLQNTDAAIAAIAQSVGYESGSRFAERFRKRFGFLPTAIRGHHRQAACPDCSLGSN